MAPPAFQLPSRLSDGNRPRLEQSASGARLPSPSPFALYMPALYREPTLTPLATSPPFSYETQSASLLPPSMSWLEGATGGGGDGAGPSLASRPSPSDASQGSFPTSALSLQQQSVNLGALRMLAQEEAADNRAAGQVLSTDSIEALDRFTASLRASTPASTSDGVAQWSTTFPSSAVIDTASSFAVNVSRMAFPPRAAAPPFPPASSSSSSSASNKKASPSGHKVYLLSCSHCAVPLSDRGMRAVLLLRPHITLFSTDAVPSNVGPLFLPDGADQKRPGPERTCDCLTQGLGCLGCGSLIGYHIARPCDRCTSSVVKHQRSANGHRFVFHQSEVTSTERLYIDSEPGVLNASILSRSPSPTVSTHASASLASDATSSSLHKHTLSSSSSPDDLSPPIRSSARGSSSASLSTEGEGRGRRLSPGDCVYWKDLVKGGERCAPSYVEVGKGKRRKSQDGGFAPQQARVLVGR